MISDFKIRGSTPLELKVKNKNIEPKIPRFVKKTDNKTRGFELFVLKVKPRSWCFPRSKIVGKFFFWIACIFTSVFLGLAPCFQPEQRSLPSFDDFWKNHRKMAFRRMKPYEKNVPILIAARFAVESNRQFFIYLFVLWYLIISSIMRYCSYIFPIKLVHFLSLSFEMNFFF